MAVGYRLRHLLRAHWRPTLHLGLIVAAVSGVVLGLAAGAGRTASAPDRYTEASGGGFDATVLQGGGKPRTAEVAALPSVSSVDGVAFIFGELSAPEGIQIPETVIFGGSYRALQATIVAGREPAGSDEFVATRSFADAAGVPLGTTFEVSTLTQEQADRAGFEASFTEGPGGPSSQVTLVGVIDSTAELDDPRPLRCWRRL